MNAFFRLQAVTVFIVTTISSSTVQAAAYAGWGTLAFNRAGPYFSLCFAGDSVDIRPDRVLNVLDHARHIEWVANIKFHPPGNRMIPIQSSRPLVPQEWRCPNNTVVNGFLPQGDLGDIRILLRTAGNRNWWTTSPVGGTGCSIINHNSSWGATGSSPRLSKWCNFNVKLGDDAPLTNTTNYYLNHTLHELGHKLGFTHEHDRSDSVCSNGSKQNGKISQTQNAAGTLISSEPLIFIAPYDIESVMNYSLSSCGAIGNHGYTGFSLYDRLSLRILYPEDNRVAELTGVRVIKVGEPLQLGNLWKHQGILVNNSDYSVANNFSWLIDGIERSTNADLTTNIDKGIHNFVYRYEDFLGRSYSFHSFVEVLEPNIFLQRMASQSVLIGTNF